MIPRVHFNEVTRYDAARHALAEAHRVDEVADIRNKAVAIQAYARQAKDRELIEHATEIRMRAEIRAGELLLEMEKNKGGGEKGVGRRGAKNAVANGVPHSAPKLDDLKITKKQSSRWQKLAKLPQEEQEAKIKGATQKAVFVIEGLPAKNVRIIGTGDYEWYTPARYIAAARAALGGIDLDPATCEFAQSRIRADQFFTAEDDGLRHEWHGRVWLNPPYSQPLVGQFISKLIEEHSAGRVTAAIILTHNYTDNVWFHKAANACSVICFTLGRISFEKEGGAVAAPTQGSSFFYFGDDIPRFRKVFGDFGFIR
jgi:phage N-6-adenine-methyltransferase